MIGSIRLAEKRSDQTLKHLAAKLCPNSTLMLMLELVLLSDSGNGVLILRCLWQHLALPIMYVNAHFSSIKLAARSEAVSLSCLILVIFMNFRQQMKDQPTRHLRTFNQRDVWCVFFHKTFQQKEETIDQSFG